jgi:hypothetical protein
MTAAGCPIQPSAIYKIEKAEPPRRITVDELVALSTVFDLPIPELLLPPEVAADRDLRKLLEAWRGTRAAESEAFHALTNYVLAHPDLEDAVEDLLNDEDREALVDVAMKGLDRMRRSGALKGMTMEDMKKASEAQKKKGGRRRG